MKFKHCITCGRRLRLVKLKILSENKEIEIKCCKKCGIFYPLEI